MFWERALLGTPIRSGSCPKRIHLPLRGLGHISISNDESQLAPPEGLAPSSHRFRNGTLCLSYGRLVPQLGLVPSDSPWLTPHWSGAWSARQESNLRLTALEAARSVSGSPGALLYLCLHCCKLRYNRGTRSAANREIASQQQWVLAQQLASTQTRLHSDRRELGTPVRLSPGRKGNSVAPEPF